MRHLMTIGAVAAMLAAGSAEAGLISASIQGNDISSLQLNGDGTWTGGYGGRAPGDMTANDWGYVTVANGALRDRTWVDEDWIGGGSVSLTGSMVLGEDATQFIGLSKRTKNRSGFNWTAFDIVLTTPSGNVTVDTGTLASPEFPGVTVLNNGTPTVTLQFTGGNVAFNQFANFVIDFEIPSGPSWTYTMTQTAIPAPGAMAILGLGGLVAGRRRR